MVFYFLRFRFKYSLNFTNILLWILGVVEDEKGNIIVNFSYIDVMLCILCYLYNRFNDVQKVFL